MRRNASRKIVLRQSSKCGEFDYHQRMACEIPVLSEAHTSFTNVWHQVPFVLFFSVEGIFKCVSLKSEKIHIFNGLMSV